MFIPEYSGVPRRTAFIIRMDCGWTCRATPTSLFRSRWSTLHGFVGHEGASGTAGGCRMCGWLYLQATLYVFLCSSATAPPKDCGNMMILRRASYWIEHQDSLDVDYILCNRHASIALPRIPLSLFYQVNYFWRCGRRSRENQARPQDAYGIHLPAGGRVVILTMPGKGMAPWRAKGTIPWVPA